MSKVKNKCGWKHKFVSLSWKKNRTSLKECDKDELFGIGRERLSNVPRLDR